MEELKKIFNNINEDTLKQWVKEEQSNNESLRLEFKRKKDPSRPDLEKEDKEHISKALSGFGNSEGGILIFGIDQRKNKVSPIKNVDEFVSRIDQFLPFAVSYDIDGVEIKRIFKKASKKDGYVKIFIPMSNKTPHMAQDNHYYKRSNTKFIPMEHFDIADMFGKRQRPNLELQMVHTKKENDEEEIRVSLRNTGRAIARFYGITITCPTKNIEIVRVQKLTDETALNEGSPTIALHNNQGVIHPNGINYTLGTFRFKRKQEKGSLLLVGFAFCDNMTMKQTTIVL